MRGLQQRLRNPRDVWAATAVAAALLAAEVALSFTIIRQVPYTEIDWMAYMEQTRLFAEGERDYLNVKGGTGPLVYPAGFLYLFEGLRRVTGGAVPAAQLCFAAFYLATQAGVMALYIHAQIVPPWGLVLLCASKRIHSIWLLRLFNDGPAMGLAYAGVGAVVARRPRLAVTLLSAGVSVKMNVLLLAPSVFVVLLQEATPALIAQGVAAGVMLQLALAAPFLAAAPGHYVSRAFELSRVFLHVWSVNLKFLPPWLFQSRGVAVVLLLCHVALLVAFAANRWTEQPGGLSALLRSSFTTPASPPAAPGSEGVEAVHRAGACGSASAPLGGATLTLRRANGAVDACSKDKAVVGKASAVAAAGSDSASGLKEHSAATAGRGTDDGGRDRPPPTAAAHVVATLFSGNFIGIVCARTLHYQFYSWYFHMLPALLWWAHMSTPQRLGLWACIEVVYNLYPSTPASSLLLLACHAALLRGLWRSPRWLGAAAGCTTWARH